MYKVITSIPPRYGEVGMQREVHVYNDNHLREVLIDACGEFIFTNTEFQFIRGSGMTLPMIMFANGGRIEVERVTH